jgi:aryl-alcohol dehydrogenase-like predicted oxidoreductase
MKKRRFGNTGAMVSEVGLGCWQLGGDCWGDLNEDKAQEILQASIDKGVTFLDTADVYGAGQSEEFIGKFLKDSTAELFVATKLGRMEPPAWPEAFTKEAMTQHTENSLKRLGVEALDLTQIHCIPTEVMREGEVFETLRGLKDAGKIKAFGASVESMDEALICLDQEGLSSLQIIFNIYRQKPIAELFEKAKKKDVAIIARVPLASGLLTGKFKVDTSFADNDHRNFNKDGQLFNVGETFAGLPYEKGVELSDKLKPFLPEGMTMVQMALRWILDHDAVSVVIPGASKVEQAAGNAVISDLAPLSDALHAKIAEFYDGEVKEHIRGLY